jgi:hypothetical protein
LLQVRPKTPDDFDRGINFYLDTVFEPIGHGGREWGVGNERIKEEGVGSRERKRFRFWFVVSE